MDIRFVSSLTPEDEERLAPVLLELVGAMLDQLPVAYTLQIVTTTGRTVQRRRAETKTQQPAKS